MLQLDLFASPFTRELPMTIEEAATQILKDAGITREFKIRKEIDGVWIIYADDPGDPLLLDQETLEDAYDLMTIANESGGESCSSGP